ncbi:MAG: carboxypeptidase regulatory-like domain-containing protein [Deltaproteobacteria bacterium]|jgi:nickel transport protein|nr:carboxypeptidase regulatory-like domain-containing protein [Deltaproteobacteria bacterium]MDD3620300.1 carboxypeptidase regulatory-like domain-containing protein [Desulfobulbaceae bacterium]
MRNHLSIFLWALAFFLGTVHVALAHKVNIFAYVEGNTVFTESYFPDGKPVEGGVVEVQDQKGVTLVEGKTDEKGLFHFPLPKKEDLTIILNASMGHKNTFLLKGSEM